MSSLAPRLMLSPRREVCRATSSWDGDSSTLRITFAYPERPPPETTDVQRRIEHDVGIEAPTYRVVLGDLDLLLEDSRRWAALDVRTNPASWLRAPLPAPSDDPDEIWAEFGVEFDANRIASLDLAADVLWDRAGRRLAFRFDPGEGGVRWCAVADRVLLGLDADGRLCELRLQAVDVPVS